MKKSRLLGGLILAGLTLVGCAGNKATIKTILETASKNEEVKVQGVVYAITNDGFYVSDGEEQIFVSDKTLTVGVGDKVNLTGSFSTNNNKPFIKNITKSKVKEGGEAITATVTPIADIANYDATAKTGVYGKYVAITGTIAQSASGAYTISDDEGKTIYFANNSDAGYKTMEGLRVDTEVVVVEKDEQLGWTVAYCGGKLEQNDLTHAQCVEMAKAHVDAKVAKTVYGKLTVPTKHNLFGDKITYEWASADETLIKFEKDGEGKLTITVAYDLAEDQDCELTCSITAAGQTTDYKFTVKVKAIKEQTVKNLLENIPEVDGSAVIVTGKVIGYSNNQSGSLYGIIIQDPENPTYSTQVDVTKAQQNSVQIGQTVRVFGYYRSIASGDRPTIQNLISFDVSGEAGAVEYTPFFTVNSEETMVELVNHWADTYCGRLIKFENCKVVWNCTADKKQGTSYVIITYTADKTAYKLNGKADGDTKICLIYQNNNRYLGTNYWADNMGIPFSGSAAADYGATFYAVPSYYTSGTIAMLSIPSIECWTANDQLTNIYANISKITPTEIQSADGAKLTLPEKVTVNEVEYDLTWTSGNTEVILDDGTTHEIQQTVKVPFTCKFTFNNEEKSYTQEISVLGARTYTVHELVTEAMDNVKVKVQGWVIGYQQNASYTAAGAKRTGIVLMDSTTGEVVYINYCKVIGGDIYTGFKDSNGTAIKVGDFVEVVGIYTLNSAIPGSGTDASNVGRHMVSVENSDSEIHVLEKPAATYSLDNAVVVTNQEELQALLTNGIQYGKLIKIVATEEAPLYMRTHSGTWTLPAADGKVSTGNNISFGYDYAKCKDQGTWEATNGGATTNLKWSMCAQGSQFVWANAGKEGTWYGLCGYDGEGSGTVVAIHGEMYITISYTNSTYYHVTMALPELFTMTGAKYTPAA